MSWPPRYLGWEDRFAPTVAEAEAALREAAEFPETTIFAPMKLLQVVLDLCDRVRALEERSA